jgi:hypothetical protein
MGGRGPVSSLGRVPGVVENVLHKRMGSVLVVHRIPVDGGMLSKQARGTTHVQHGDAIHRAAWSVTATGTLRLLPCVTTYRRH